MIRNSIRNILKRYGYDIIKTAHFNYGKEFKRASDDEDFDYYETPIGNYYLPKDLTGDGVANDMKVGKLFDKHIIDISKSYIRPGSIVLDIGANYGQMAVEFSRIEPSSIVYAFEAQEMVYHILKKNIKANNATNVKPFYNAVYDQNDINIIFPIPDLKKFPSYGSYGIDLKAKTGKVVKSITIDSLDFNMPISFMKVDIQGSDLAAMRGSFNTIKKHKMPIIFEYEEHFQAEFNTSFQDYVDFVDSIGYRFEKTVEAINYLIVPRNI